MEIGWLPPPFSPYTAGGELWFKHADLIIGDVGGAAGAARRARRGRQNGRGLRY